MLRNSKTFHHHRANWRLDYLLYRLSLIQCLNTVFRVVSIIYIKENVQTGRFDMIIRCPLTMR
jgi:hypothetical protein